MESLISPGPGVRGTSVGGLPVGAATHRAALRTRRAGSRRFADFHLLVPGNLSVRAAHDFAELIEATVRTALPSVELTIHIEPIEEQASWSDNMLAAFEPDAEIGRASSPPIQDPPGRE